MKKGYLLIVLSLLLLIAFSGFLLVNTLVSIKYETDPLNDCISTVTGINLCESKRFLKIVLYSGIASLFFIILVMEWILPLKNLLKNKF